MELLQHGLELVFVSRRSESVDVAGHLPELQGQTLHFTERFQHRFGGLFDLRSHLRLLLGVFFFCACSTKRAFCAFDGEGNRTSSQAGETREPTEA